MLVITEKLDNLLYGKNRDEIISILLNIPDFDSDFVEAASEILTMDDSIDIKLSHIGMYSGICLKTLIKTINILSNGKYYIDENNNFIECDKCSTANTIDMVLRLFDQSFNSTQISLYNRSIDKLGIKKVAPFINSKIPYANLNYILTAIEDGFDQMGDEKYLNGYDSDQLKEIYCGFVAKVDTSVYDNKNYSAEIMGLARHAMVLGVSPEATKNIINIVLNDE